MLDGLPAKGSLRQMRFTQSGLRHRLLAVRGTNAIERAMCSSHVSTNLMTRERTLLCMCVHCLGEKLYFFNCTLQAHPAEAKANELEQLHQIQGRRSRLDLFLVKRRAFQVK